MKKFIISIILLLIITSMFTGYVSAAAKYKDIKDSDWFAEAIGKLSALKIIDGLPDGSFNPQGQVTRAEFVKMLVQAMEYKKIDSISFEDIKPFPTSKPHWASVYIETALRNGVIIKEEEGDKFYPDVPLTRKDMVMMMYRALKLEPSEGKNPYFDLPEPNGYFTKAYEEYLVRGIPMNGKFIFNPTGVTTRAEAATIISRMVEYKADPSGFVAKAAMEERFAKGIQTAEDIALKREIEIDRAKSDPNYIMEPIIRILNTLEDFKGHGADAEGYFKNIAGHIALDNFEDYLNYTPECQFKVVCTTKGKDLNNSVTWLTQPFISYDHVYDVRTDGWEVAEEALKYAPRELKTCSIMTITRNEEKSVNGKWTKVPDYNKKGEVIDFKLYIKRRNNTKEYDIKFKVN
ncbi:MAG TPA: S-layer homology domain-containing protein [Bacillota bacterium]|nr:S-layer homology domain-containing protein [Bacillota bacterium]